MYCEGMEDETFPDDDPDLIGDRYDILFTNSQDSPLHSFCPSILL